MLWGMELLQCHVVVLQSARRGLSSSIKIILLQVFFVANAQRQSDAREHSISSNAHALSPAAAAAEGKGEEETQPARRNRHSLLFCFCSRGINALPNSHPDPGIYVTYNFFCGNRAQQHPHEEIQLLYRAKS